MSGQACGRQLAAVGCALLCLFAYLQMRHVAATFGSGLRYPFGDFFAFWSYAQVAAEQPATVLYDWDVLHAAQVRLGMDQGDELPFPYPPTFVLVLWPLAFLSYWTGLATWLAATFVPYAAAVLAGRRRRAVLLPAVVLAPATTVAALMGQSGFLAGALLIGGMRLSERFPVWGGVLLGLLTYKPQFGVLVPFALLAAGRWRCVASACTTAALLGVAATALFGPACWTAWIDSLPAYQRWFDGRTEQWRHLPTVLANARMLGVPPELANWLQLAASCCAAAVVWAGFRTSPTRLAIPVLLVCTFLATPHAVTYDTPALAGAALLYVAHCLETDRYPALLERTALVLVLLLPEFMLSSLGDAPVSTPVLALFLLVLLRRQSRERIAARSPGAPSEEPSDGRRAPGLLAQT